MFNPSHVKEIRRVDMVEDVSFLTGNGNKCVEYSGTLPYEHPVNTTTSFYGYSFLARIKARAVMLSSEEPHL